MGYEMHETWPDFQKQSIGAPVLGYYPASLTAAAPAHGRGAKCQVLLFDDCQIGMVTRAEEAGI